MRRFFCIGLFLICWLNSYSQDSLKVLKEVVVSATRTEEEILQVSRAVEVIDQDEIRSSGANSVGEILSERSMAFVVGATQTPGTNQDLFLRGANSNHVAILIDGVRVSDPSSPNNAFNLAELSLANVERIEIVHGPHSTMYGTAAIGGVINIITQEGKRGLEGYASIRGGVFDEGSLGEGTAFMSYGFENGFYFTGSAFHQNVNGLDASIGNVDPNMFQSSDKDDFEKTDLSIKAGYIKNNWDGFVEYKSADQLSDIDAGAFNDDDNYTLDLKRDFLNYGLSRSVGNVSIKFNGGYTKAERTAINDSSLIDESGSYDGTYFSSLYEGSVLTNEVVGSYKNENITVVGGLGNYREEMNFNTYYFSNAFGFDLISRTNYDSVDLTQTISHAFVSANVVPDAAKRFNIRVGSRYNIHSTAGNFFTYEISPSYNPVKNGNLYITYAKGFNAPSLYQLYDQTQQPLSTRVRGNENLRPETSGSIELGYKQVLNNGMMITGALFHNTVNDAIEYVYLWDGTIPVDDLGAGNWRGDTYINVNEQVTYGFEVGASGELFKNFNVDINFTSIRGTVTTSDENLDRTIIGENHIQIYSNGQFVSELDSEGSSLIRRPSIMLNTSIRYSFTPSFYSMFTFQHIGNRNDAVYDYTLGPFGALGITALDSFNLLGFSSAYAITEHLQIALSIQNLLDERYSEINGYNSMGRSFYLKLAYEL